MALNVTRLKNAIKASLIAAEAVQTDREDGLEVFANNLAVAIIDEIKQASITYTTGLTAGANPVVGTFGNNIT
jgi:hypothetical protein